MSSCIEADLLTVRNHGKSPTLLTDVAAEVRKAKGKIWMIEFCPFGTQIRANILKRYLRVVLRSRTNPYETIPHESNSELYVIDNIDGLRVWLAQFSPTKNG